MTGNNFETWYAAHEKSKDLVDEYQKYVDEMKEVPLIPRKFRQWMFEKYLEQEFPPDRKREDQR